MDEEIDFGTIGIKIGDQIKFMDDVTVFSVSSGNGTPGNGGTLISYEDRREIGSFSLRYMTRKLMGSDFNENIDIFELWKYNNKTLRSIHKMNNKSD